MQMVRIDGGEFSMGDARFYRDEQPIHRRTVESFELDVHPVTVAQFAEFVREAGYVTVAEREMDPTLFPGANPADLVPGSMVFTPTSGPVNLADWRAWWRWVPGASWRNPWGPGTGIDGLLEHPVTQVSFEDANAYAAWAGKRLPTEAEFEYAARGGLDGTRYAWGDELTPGGRLMANTWQGRFPYQNTGAAGWVGTSPVGSFPANGYGLRDVIGNVWEWTSDEYHPFHIDPEAAFAEAGGRPNLLGDPEPAPQRRVLKGGSHLCSPDYCLRYRPAARSPQSDDSATTHIGFRCAKDL
ncbi:formylglycine-generating enzyme family protein [Paeniglutamicibacter sp. R2-26]|uniref:formylglycine-generating enzyme family protein n=1 Tax=Paeniglutamicibacter sp. R2-26 TaxID=3144417 RepID=UPI003EE5F30E